MANEFKTKFDGPINRISFWGKDTGSYCSYHMGLTKPEVDYLQSLQVGDRLWMVPYEPRDAQGCPRARLEKDPHFHLKRFKRDGETLADGTVYRDKFKQKEEGNGSAGQDDEAI